MIKEKLHRPDKIARTFHLSAMNARILAASVSAAVPPPLPAAATASSKPSASILIPQNIVFVRVRRGRVQMKRDRASDATNIELSFFILF